MAQSPRCEVCPSVDVEVNRQHIQTTRAKGSAHQHRGLPGLPQVTCPLREHRHVDQFGDVLTQLGGCLFVRHTQDEARALTDVGRPHDHLMQQNQRREFGLR